MSNDDNGHVWKTLLFGRDQVTKHTQIEQSKDSKIRDLSESLLAYKTELKSCQESLSKIKNELKSCHEKYLSRMKNSNKGYLMQVKKLKEDLKNFKEIDDNREEYLLNLKNKDNLIDDLKDKLGEVKKKNKECYKNLSTMRYIRYNGVNLVDITKREYFDIICLI